MPFMALTIGTSRGSRAVITSYSIHYTKLYEPLQLVRKPGKLPYKTAGYDYTLEYGTDRLEVHIDAIRRDQRVAIVDDLLATGGTAAATAKLIEQQGGEVACCAFVIELAALRGRDKLARWPVEHVSYPNRVLRQAGLLQVTVEDGRELLDFEKSRAVITSYSIHYTKLYDHCC